MYKEGTLHPDSELTGKFSRKGPRVDTNSVIEEIQAAAAEAAKTPVSGYRAKKERQLAEATAAEEARAAQGAKEKGESEGGKGKQRRRRRRRRPRGGGSS